MKMLHVVFTILIFALTASAQSTKEKSDNKKLAPSFNAATMEGTFINSDDLRGKIVVLNFWFINCGECVREIPLLNKIVAEYKDKEVVFLGLATNSRTELQRFLKTNPFHYQIVPNALEFMLLNFGENRKGTFYIGFPTHIVIDREGYVTLKTEGIRGIEAVKRELKRQFEQAVRSEK